MALTRKDFFKGLAIGTISLPFAIRGCGGKNYAQKASKSNGIIRSEKIQWKMVTTWAPNFPILGEGCNKFAELVNKMSGGRIEIRVYGANELVPALESFEAVSNGAADMSHGAGYYWAGKVPAAQFFASIPFGMNAQQLNAWILTGGGMELWRELYADFGVVPMLGGNTGVQMGGWFNREINTLEDLKGLKMRIPGLGGKVLDKAKGSPVLLAGGEIYTGLERGVIDATEWIGPSHDFSMGFHQIAKYYYSPGWHEPGTALEFTVNKEKYDALPEDLKAIVESAALQINHWMLSEFETKNSLFLKKLEEENVEVRYFPPEVLNQLRVFTDEMLADMVKKDAFTKRVYESYNAYRKKAKAWSELSEKVYYNQLQ